MLCLCVMRKYMQMVLCGESDKALPTTMYVSIVEYDGYNHIYVIVCLWYEYNHVYSIVCV